MRGEKSLIAFDGCYPHLVKFIVNYMIYLPLNGYKKGLRSKNTWQTVLF